LLCLGDLGKPTPRKRESREVRNRTCEVGNRAHRATAVRAPGRPSCRAQLQSAAPRSVGRSLPTGSTARIMLTSKQRTLAERSAQSMASRRAPDASARVTELVGSLGNEERWSDRATDFRGPGAAPAVFWSEIGRDPAPEVVPVIKTKLGRWKKPKQTLRSGPPRARRMEPFPDARTFWIPRIPMISAPAGAWGAAGRGSSAVPSRRPMKSAIAPHAMGCTRRQAGIVQSNRKLHTDV
jgi:hypothetical protein